VRLFFSEESYWWVPKCTGVVCYACHSSAVHRQGSILPSRWHSTTFSLHCHDTLMFTFYEGRLKRKCVEYPSACSSDLMPLNCSCYGTWRTQYSKKQAKLQEPWYEIEESCAAIATDTSQQCMDANGGQFDHLLQCSTWHKALLLHTSYIIVLYNVYYFSLVKCYTFFKIFCEEDCILGWMKARQKKNWPLNVWISRE